MPLRSGPMRALTFTCLIFLLLSFRCLAVLPEIVAEQIRHDVRGAIIRLAPQGYTPPVQEVEEILTLVLREMNSDNDPFELSPAELVDFRKGETSLSFEELARLMNLLKKGVNNKPLPHLLAYYDHLLDQKALSPKQKIICHRMIMHAAASSKVALPTPPAAKP